MNMSTNLLVKQERAGVRTGSGAAHPQAEAPNRLRPDLRTGYAEGGRTSQGPEHCPSRSVASLFRALPIRGSPSIGVTCS